jgi:hypothetical protein
MYIIKTPKGYLYIISTVFQEIHHFMPNKDDATVFFFWDSAEAAIDRFQLEDAEIIETTLID